MMDTGAMERERVRDLWIVLDGPHAGHYGDDVGADLLGPPVDAQAARQVPAGVERVQEMPLQVMGACARVSLYAVPGGLASTPEGLRVLLKRNVRAWEACVVYLSGLLARYGRALQARAAEAAEA